MTVPVTTLAVSKTVCEEAVIVDKSNVIENTGITAYEFFMLVGHSGYKVTNFFYLKFSSYLPADYLTPVAK
jgi:hypothetical protein